MIDVSFGTKSVSDILQESRDLLGSFTKIEPPEKWRDAQSYWPQKQEHFIAAVYAPADFEWHRVIANIYMGEEGEGFEIRGDCTLIKHGHPVGKMCHLRTMCHVAGYMPTEPEKFVSKFKEKFGYE